MKRASNAIGWFCSFAVGLAGCNTTGAEGVVAGGTTSGGTGGAASSSSTASASSSAASGGGAASSSSAASSSASGAGGGVASACGAPIGAALTLAQGQDLPYWVAVDATSVYWANAETLSAGITSSQGSVMKIGLEGGAVSTLVSGVPGTLGISALAVGAKGVYWTAAEGTVMRVGLDGGATTTLASGQAAPSGIAVDAKSVYWVDQGTPVGNGDASPAPGTGSVAKVSLDGSGLAVLASGLDAPSSIAVDATSVYWTISGTEGADYTDGAVMKIGLDGQGMTTLASGFDGRFAGGIAVDATSVYWVTAETLGGQSGAVYRVGLDGQGLQALVTLAGLEGQLAVGADDLYFNATGADLCGDAGGPCGGVLRSGKDGSCLTVLASAQDVPWGIAVGPTRVYWVDNGQPGLTGTLTALGL